MALPDRTKLVPLQPRLPVRLNYLAPGAVIRVFDTNGFGELLQVTFRRNPFDAIEFELDHQPYGQIYAEVLA